MNVLLLEPSEIENETVRLDGRRAEHCLKVLKVRPGSRVRAAVLENGAVEAEISTVGVDSLGLRLGQIQPAPKPQLHIALAIPRPKALSRIIQATSSFGVASITLFNAWKVEKSYLTSPRLAPSRLAQDALLGCEQGRQCHLPELRVEMRFVEFLNRQAVPPPNEASYVLDPTAEQRLNVPLATASDRSPPPPCRLVFGPEGGFIEREIASFSELGWAPVRLEAGPLRTEVAIAAALGVITSSPRYQSTHLRFPPLL